MYHTPKCFLSRDFCEICRADTICLFRWESLNIHKSDATPTVFHLQNIWRSSQVCDRLCSILSSKSHDARLLLLLPHCWKAAPLNLVSVGYGATWCIDCLWCPTATGFMGSNWGSSVRAGVQDVAIHDGATGWTLFTGVGGTLHDTAAPNTSAIAAPTMPIPPP